MKYTYKHSLLILVIFILFSSCKKDWFDIKNQDKLTVPNTLKDFQALLDNSPIMNFNDVSIGEAASGRHYVTGVNFNRFSQNDKNAYTWSQEQPSEIVLDWVGNNSGGGYSRIYYCNLILDGLAKVKNRNIMFDNIKGQALFQRARTFHQLAEVFAPPHIPGRTDNELGIPLRLEADINIPSKRSTLKETYDQILNDLLLAKDLLPNLPEFKTRGSKAAALALLARVYLSIEDYNNAAKYANQSLGIYSTLIEYTSLDVNAVQPIVEFNQECIFQAVMLNIQSVRRATILIDEDFYNSYRESDARKGIFFQKNLTTNLVTYKGSYSGLPVPFTGMATDELYLIRAECNARLGKVGEAMTDLNALLVKRYKPGFVPRWAIDKDDALKQILEERKKELVWRGLGWSDLRRLNRDNRFKVTLTRIANGKTYILEPDSYRYTFPIPNDIIRMTNMPQNTGW